MSAVSKNIKKLRLQKNLTQEEMAGKLFVTRQTVSNWEIGKSQPDIDTLIKIAETFDTDTTVLIYGIPESSNRRKEKNKLIIGAGVLLILGISAFFFDQVAQNEIRYYHGSPMMLFRLFLLPLFWLVLGWEVSQGLDIIGVVKPIKAKYGRFVRIAMLSIVFFYTVIMVPFFIGMVDCWIQHSIYMQKAAQLTDSSFSFSWSYPLPILNDIHFAVSQIVSKQPVIFVIPGLIFRLFKPIKQQDNVTEN